MTDEEKDEANIHRVRSPPTCKCGYHAELVNSYTGLDYISDFNEHVYGPMLHLSDGLQLLLPLD
jgi:hypothetical protein